MSGGAETACSTTAGFWNGRCYIQSTDPQPASDNVLWGGHTDGVIVTCTMAKCVPGAMPDSDPDDPSCVTLTYWVATSPDVAADPADVAELAVAQMDFQAGRIAMNPAISPDTMSIVNLQTWLWIADPGENTTGPITRTATTGDVTVTATGTMDSIVWDMGDGNTVTCTTPGTPYPDDADDTQDQESPDCGYTYPRSSANQPDNTYTLTATTHWTITWTGGGQAGTIPLDFTRTIAVPVGEIQTIITSTS